MPRPVVMFLLAACACWAQPGDSNSRAAGAGCDSRNGARIYSISVRVTTEKFEPVGGLRPTDFTLTENGKPLSICGFSHSRLPSSIGIVLDTSGSMRGNLAITDAFGSAFLERSGPQDEYFLEYAGEPPSFQCDFTRDLARLRPGLRAHLTKGGSAIWDAIDLGLAAMRRARNFNRALLVISDGADNSSALRIGDIMRTLLSAPAPIFLLAPAGGPKANSFEKKAEAKTLRLITRSGGFALPISDRQYVDDAASKIATAIQSPYVLSFAPLRPGEALDSQKIKVEVRGVRPRPSVFVGVAVPGPQ